MKPRILTILFVLLAVMVAGCTASVTREAAPSRHPEELADWEGGVDCLECHDDERTGTLKPYGTFTHSNAFLLGHGDYAAQGQDLCNSCHGDSFCLSCHATGGGLLPDIRFGNRPDPTLSPHRGDYMVQHRIDGRIDPGSCLPCHGNRNTGSCAPCHR